MKENTKAQTVSVDALEHALSCFIETLEGQIPLTLYFYENTIRQFLKYAKNRTEPQFETVVIDDDFIFKWMLHAAEGITVKYAATKFRTLKRFLDTLCRTGLIADNPLVAFRARFTKNGWNGIASAMISKDPQKALYGLRDEPRFVSFLGGQMKNYVRFKHSLGRRFRTEEGTLAGFDKFLREEKITSPEAITTNVIHRWVSQMTCSPITATHKICMLSHFFDYLIDVDITTSNPVAAPISDVGRASSFIPYIFSKDEVSSVLSGTKKLTAHHQFLLRPQTIHATIAVLYALGLRLGEVIRLRIGDLDLDRGTLFIKDTKFNKNRLIPFGTRLGKCLQRYLALRETLFSPLIATDHLFSVCRSRPVSENVIRHAYHELVETAGITAQGGKRPRIHDLRHTFAVHRLLRWYREGVNVQTKLPLLATFMGHISIRSTQVYLNITTDLLDEASKRFAKWSGYMFEEETTTQGGAK